MQAQNATEREKSAKNGQYPTPPARSKAGRVGIAKECIDFLLDHRVSSLLSSTHASYWKHCDVTVLLKEVRPSKIGHENRNVIT